MVGLQPANRDIGVGIFFPITHFRVRHPQLTVARFLSEHFVYSNEKSIQEMRRTVLDATHYGDKVVLLGALSDP